ncbi:unnamed protein product [Rotaria magnacalcarata]|nr:unnamed protein product [Rotaria magnacalcarata]
MKIIDQCSKSPSLQRYRTNGIEYQYDDNEKLLLTTKITLNRKEEIVTRKMIKQQQSIEEYVQIPIPIRLPTTDAINIMTIMKPCLPTEKQSSKTKQVSNNDRLPRKTAELDIPETRLTTPWIEMCGASVNTEELTTDHIDGVVGAPVDTPPVQVGGQYTDTAHAQPWIRILIQSNRIYASLPAVSEIKQLYYFHYILLVSACLKYFVDDSSKTAQADLAQRYE